MISVSCCICSLPPFVTRLSIPFVVNYDQSLSRSRFFPVSPVSRFYSLLISFEISLFFTSCLFPVSSLSTIWTVTYCMSCLFPCHITIDVLSTSIFSCLCACCLPTLQILKFLIPSFTSIFPTIKTLWHINT